MHPGTHTRTCHVALPSCAKSRDLPTEPDTIKISEKFACLIQDLPTRNLPMFQKKS